MNTCENCGYEVREGRKHRSDGDGHCLILDSETLIVVGAANRKPPRDLYKNRKSINP